MHIFNKKQVWSQRGVGWSFRSREAKLFLHVQNVFWDSLPGITRGICVATAVVPKPECTFGHYWCCHQCANYAWQESDTPPDIRDAVFLWLDNGTMTRILFLFSPKGTVSTVSPKLNMELPGHSHTLHPSTSVRISACGSVFTCTLRDVITFPLDLHVDPKQPLIV